jgi:3-oxoacyl-[acyl-carrier protein] reductase
LSYCIVTGGSSGIGLQIARDMRERGDEVLVWDIKPAPAVAGLQCEPVDLTQIEAIRAAAARTPRNVDVFVHCAGVLAPTTIVDDQLASQMLLAFQVHCLAFVVTVQALLPKFTPGSASIVAIASVGMDMVYPATLAYGSSKAALRRAIEQMAVELAGRGIRVNGIAPGAIATDMTRHLWRDPVFAAERTRHIPLGRQAEPKVVSDAVAFLTSAAAGYITGQTLSVDGGVHHGIFLPGVRALVDGAGGP